MTQQGLRVGLLALVIAVGLWFSLVYAQSSHEQSYRLAVVNLGKLLNEAPQALAETKRLESLFSSRESELSQEKLQLDNAQEALQLQADTLSEADRVQHERELRSRQRDYVRKLEDYREAVSIARNDSLQKVQDEIDQAVEAVRARDNIDLVFRESHYMAASERINMTDQVLAYLQQQFDQEQAHLSGSAPVSPTAATPTDSAKE